MRRDLKQRLYLPLFPVSFAVIVFSLVLTAIPAQADDASGLLDRALFREPRAATLSGDQVYHLVTGQVVTCTGEPGSRDCKYELRYNHDFPGEQMKVLPGGRLNIQLINRLPGLSEDILGQLDPRVIGGNDDPATIEMIAKASSVTNLHTHGLHVSPAERSDNVMLKINSGKANVYNIALPPEHAPGTHWYHAHLHGSTALQVQGGMAGALLVDPLPGQSLNPPGFPIQEHVMVLQFGSGWKFNEAQPEDETSALESMSRKTLTGPQNDQLTELVDAESTDDLLALTNRLDPAKLSELLEALGSLRLELPPVFVNGQENPVLKVQQDVAVQRFRVVNAGSRFPDYKDLWIENRASPGQSLPMYVAAIDGVNLTQLPKNAGGEYVAYTEENPLNLAPGNRADIFFIPDTAGTYSLMMEGEIGVRDSEDQKVSIASMTDEELTPTRLKFQRSLLTLEVGGPDVESAAAQAEKREMGPAPFLRALDLHLQALQQRIPAYGGGYLRPFEDGGDYIRRDIVFDVQRATGRPFLINGRSYNTKNEHGHMEGHDDYLGKVAGDGGRGPAGQTPWPLRSNTEEEWTIRNDSNRVHPFHIHVSPFWVVDIVEMDEATGQLVSVRETNPHDPRLDRWQDTVTLPPEGGSVTVRHRVSQFTGLYVIHCHILQHEDRGMMINVLTVPEGERDPQAFFEKTNRRNAEINQEIDR